MDKMDWIRCPKCSSKTRTMIREHTVLEDFPLFCPKCRYACVIRFMDGKLEEIQQPDAKTQSRTGCEVKSVLRFFDAALQNRNEKRKK